MKNELVYNDDVSTMNQNFDTENEPLKKDPERWGTGLFDCYKDKQSCFETLFCCYCQNARHYNKLKHNNPNINYELCAFLICLDMTLGYAGSFVMTMKNRNLIRESYNIYDTNIVNDIVATSNIYESNIISELVTILLCTPCAICQQDRELKQRCDLQSLTNHFKPGIKSHNEMK